MDKYTSEMLSFMWIVRSWLLDCTAHGVPKVISSANFHRKIFWVASVIVCSACFVFQITIMFQDVFSYPVFVSVQIKYPDYLVMPTVTICNSNKLKESLLRSFEDHIDTDLHKMIDFEGLNTIGMDEIEEELYERVHGRSSVQNKTISSVRNSSDSSAESNESNSRCESNYQTDWTSDTSIRDRYDYVS